VPKRGPLNQNKVKFFLHRRKSADEKDIKGLMMMMKVEGNIGQGSILMSSLSCHFISQSHHLNFQILQLLIYDMNL
jgi:hypothetical protein